jgi:hypothetical protein
MIPGWAKKIGLNAKQLRAMAEDRIPYLLWHLYIYANTKWRFDVTFITREPILEVQLDQSFAYEFRNTRQNKDASELPFYSKQ